MALWVEQGSVQVTAASGRPGLLAVPQLRAVDGPGVTKGDKDHGAPSSQKEH